MIDDDDDDDDDNQIFRYCITHDTVEESKLKNRRIKSNQCRIHPLICNETPFPDAIAMRYKTRQS